MKIFDGLTDGRNFEICYHANRYDMKGARDHMAYEIVSGKDDKPFFDTEYFLEGFKTALKREKELREEDPNNCWNQQRFVDAQEDNYLLAQKLSEIGCPDIVRENDLEWNAKRHWHGKGYFIGIIEDEYARSKKNFVLYKKALLSSVDQEEKDRLESWCRSLLKSLYILEKGLELKNN